MSTTQVEKINSNNIFKRLKELENRSMTVIAVVNTAKMCHTIT